MGYEGSLGGNTPTQNLVDAFEMKDGTSFDWNNAEHVQNMYVDVTGNPTRDPRLYLNVLYNGATWLKQKVETNVGGLHTGMDGATKTGYYLRKHMNEFVSGSCETIRKRTSLSFVPVCRSPVKLCGSYVSLDGSGCETG